MSWNAASPNGSLSVKNNRTQMNNNNTYIETTMGNVPNDSAYSTSLQDHFWDVGNDYSGHHRFIKSPAFTVGGIPTDPGSTGLGTGMDGILYLKTTNSRVQGFYRNIQGIYQYIPAFLSGSVSITSTSSFVNVAAVPANVYGDISIWKFTNNANPALSDLEIQTASFVSNNNTVHAFSNRIKQQGVSDDYFIEFSNKSTVDLNIKARLNDGASGTWNYRITYRAQ